jgi:hypothetical protein
VVLEESEAQIKEGVSNIRRVQLLLIKTLVSTHLVESRVQLDPRSEPTDNGVVVSLLGEVGEVLQEARRQRESKLALDANNEKVSE